MWKRTVMVNIECQHDRIQNHPRDRLHCMCEGVSRLGCSVKTHPKRRSHHSTAWGPGLKYERQASLVSIHCFAPCSWMQCDQPFLLLCLPHHHGLLENINQNELLVPLTASVRYLVTATRKVSSTGAIWCEVSHGETNTRV